MKKFLFLLLVLTGIGQKRLFAQESGSFRDKLAQITALQSPAGAVSRGAFALQLDSTWESGFAFSPDDSVVRRKELYTYFGDTLIKKDVFDRTPLNEFVFLNRVTTGLNPVTGTEAYVFYESLATGTMDTSDLVRSYYNPAWPDLLDSSKSWLSSFLTNNLEVYFIRKFAYNNDQDIVTAWYENYDFTTGDFVFGNKSEYTYLADDKIDELVSFQMLAGSGTWDMTGKSEYHYTGDVVDTIYHFTYNPNGFTPDQLITFMENANGNLTQYEIYTWDAGAFKRTFLLELTYDGQGRIATIKNTGFENGVPNYGDETFITYLVDDHPKLEKSYNLDPLPNEYIFDSAREYFYSGAVGTATPQAVVPLALAPNPALHTLQVTAPAGAWVEVISANGSVVLRRQLTEDGANMLNVSALPSGPYFVSATTATTRHTGIFVKL